MWHSQPDPGRSSQTPVGFVVFIGPTHRHLRSKYTSTYPVNAAIIRSPSHAVSPLVCMFDTISTTAHHYLGEAGANSVKHVLAHAQKTFAQLQSLLSSNLQPSPAKPTTWQESIYENIADFFAARTSLENTSLLLALTTFLFLLVQQLHKMSWTSRLGNLGRFSPFTRSGHGSAKVSDSDFSYITADDLRQHQDEINRDQQSRHGMSESPTDYGPSRDTDVLILRNNKGREYAVHFAAYSIARGELTVQKVREEAAKKAHSSTSRVKLYYKGKQLKDDTRTAKHEGLRDGSEILLSVAESDDSSGDSGDDDLDGPASPTGEDGQRKRRNRGKKSKRKNRREAAREAESGTSTPDHRSSPNLGVPLSQASTHTGGSRAGSRAQSPKPPGTPLTALDKINALRATLTSYQSDVDNFLRHPPDEQSKRDFEHKKLSETILTQVLLKLDAVETEGDADARTRRKELVKETQGVLNELDAAMKK